jgi:putative PEP-CTERM system histidine kinase
VACLCLGALVLAKNWRRMEARLFFAVMAALAFKEMARFMVLQDPEGAGTLFFAQLAASATCLLPGTLYAFTAVAARRDWRSELRRRWLAASFFAAGSLLFAPLAFHGAFLTRQDDYNGSVVLLLGPLGHYFYVFFLIACAAVLMNLEGLLRSTAGPSRWHVKYGVLGLSGIVIGFIFMITQNLVYHSVRVDNIPILSLAILLSLIPLSYGVVRARFLETDVFVSRYVVYNSLAVMALGAYLIAMGLMAKLVGYAGLQYTLFWKFFLFFASGMALAVLLLSSDVRTRIKHFINRHFYKNKYDYRLQWAALSKRLSTLSRKEDVAQAVVETLRESMFTREVSLWLCHEDAAEFILAARSGVAQSEEAIKAESGLLSWLATRGRTIRRSELEEEVPLAYGEHLELIEGGLAAVLLTPLMAGEKLLGFITVGAESTGRDFVEDDFDLLDSVAAQAAGRLLGTYLTQSLIKAQEEQVFHRLTSFVVHDLKNFISMLSLVVQNAEKHLADPEFQRDALATVREAIEKMKTLSDRLSAARQQKFELRPEPLRLNDLAREAAAAFTANGTRLSVESSDAASVLADREQLSKVLTNLLLNAAEAGATEISLSTQAENGWATLAVTDNGPGIDPIFREKSLFQLFATTKKKGLGIGLYQSRTIVEAHGGRLEVESKPELGTTFKVRLPVAKQAA